MPSRVAPTDKIRVEIDALFGSGRDLAEIIEDVSRLGARLLVQTAVEAEIDELWAGPATSAVPGSRTRSRASVTVSARPRSRPPAGR